MSRVGKKPISVPDEVEANVNGNEVRVKGPKGELVRSFSPDMNIFLKDSFLIIERPSDNRIHRSLHGLTRTLLANMVEGVSKGFQKSIEVIGTGYRATKTGEGLTLQVGFSHPVKLAIPEGISVSVGGAKVTVSGTDKEQVGEFAARIRRVRPPNPYSGKGIRYADEIVHRKTGKKAGGK